MLESIPTASFSLSSQLFPQLPGYRSLIERSLKARLVYGSPHMNRSLSFEYMNSQLVWNEFSEMLLLLLPLLNSSSVKNFLRPFSKDKSSSLERDEALCPIFQATSTTPFLALPCQHRYCYYCL
ncbi:peroxisome biogenesis protein 2-like [Primulina tabacum]|uniref:peroxisome biogenesis protein 2-like n=1 Tax=Primulina tabacum TaxID=48773 RepID=UPI003F59D3DB